MDKIGEYLKNIRKVAITGHVSPDGDSIGACLGLLNYLRDNYPEITAHVYLQEAKKSLCFLPLCDQIRHEDKKEDYDLMILLDISSLTRITFAEAIFKRTPLTLCIDHHLTNPGGFTWMINDPFASSACEVLYRFFDLEKISKDCATCLYTGIVHDTGVFQYSSTSSETMRIAGCLMDKGVDFTRIIEESFFEKTFLQNKVAGEIMANASLYLQGKVIIGSITRERRKELGVSPVDLDGVVASLRNTQGVDAAVFLYQLDDGLYKISLRSRNVIDCSKIASEFGGGGHIRASGAKVQGKQEDIIERILDRMKDQFEEE